MKRAARWLFTACAALSLLLLVAVIAMWVRSHFVYEWLSASRYERLDAPTGPAVRLTAWTLGTRHSLKLTWTRTWSIDQPTSTRDAGWTFDSVSFPLRESGGGSIRGGDLTGEWRRQSMRDGARAEVRLLVVPYWAVCLLLAVAPVTWLRRRLRHPNRGEGDVVGSGGVQGAQEGISHERA